MMWLIRLGNQPLREISQACTGPQANCLERMQSAPSDRTGSTLFVLHTAVT
jgi:hypothetical protein